MVGRRASPGSTKVTTASLVDACEQARRTSDASAALRAARYVSGEVDVAVDDAAAHADRARRTARRRTAQPRRSATSTAGVSRRFDVSTQAAADVEYDGRQHVGVEDHWSLRHVQAREDARRPSWHILGDERRDLKHAAPRPSHACTRRCGGSRWRGLPRGPRTRGARHFGRCQLIAADVVHRGERLPESTLSPPFARARVMPERRADRLSQRARSRPSWTGTASPARVSGPGRRRP